MPTGLNLVMANSKFEGTDLSCFIVFKGSTSTALCRSHQMDKKYYWEIIFTSEGIPHGAELTILSNWEETSCELILRLMFPTFCQET